MVRKPRMYKVEVVKGDKIIAVPESNHFSQMIREAESDRFLNAHPLERRSEPLAGWKKYGLTATNPLSLTKGKNK
jgi:hypothetical protein